MLVLTRMARRGRRGLAHDALSSCGSRARSTRRASLKCQRWSDRDAISGRVYEARCSYSQLSRECACHKEWLFLRNDVLVVGWHGHAGRFQPEISSSTTTQRHLSGHQQSGVLGPRARGSVSWTSFQDWVLRIFHYAQQPSPLTKPTRLRRPTSLTTKHETLPHRRWSALLQRRFMYRTAASFPERAHPSTSRTAAMATSTASSDTFNIHNAHPEQIRA